MPDSEQWRRVRQAREDTKSVPLSKPDKERYLRALKLYLAYQRAEQSRGRGSVDPEFERLLQLLSDPRRVHILTIQIDRERLQTAVDHYIAHMKATGRSDPPFEDLQRRLRDIDSGQ